MKKLFLVTLSAGLVLSATAQKTTPVKKPATKPATKPAAKPAAGGVVLKNLSDSASYALGVNIASSLKMQNMTHINTALLNRAMQDVFNNKPTLIDENASFMVLNAYAGKMQEEKSRGAIDSGQAYLAKNKLRPGVKVTSTGLQYEVINAGSGPKPTAEDTVTVHYRGTLIDGSEFDASYKHGQPISFPLNRVIPGWTEGLQLMSPGAKYKLFIPYNLGYGLQGSPPVIPGGAALIFEVELLDVKKAGGTGQ
jgi:FKBP-type peptidyl-prolyl cis-trans isomerase FkpA